MNKEIRQLIIDNQAIIFDKIVADKLKCKINNIVINVNNITPSGKLWFNYKYTAVYDNFTDNTNGGMHLN